MKKIVILTATAIMIAIVSLQAVEPEVERLYLKARDLKYLRKYAEAVDTLKQAYSLDPKYTPTLYLLGDIYIILGNLKGATQAYNQLREAIPQSPSGYTMLARVNWHMEDYETALEYLKTAAQLSTPPSASVYRWKGQVYRSMGKPKESEEVLWEGLKHYPDNPELLANYGATLFFLGDGKGGQEYIDSAYNIDSMSCFVINSRVSYNLMKSDLKAAEYYLDRAMSLHPDDPFTRQNVLSFSVVEVKEEAQQLLRDGNQAFTKSLYRKAAEKFNQALEIDSSFYEAWFNLAFSYIHLGEAEKAENAFSHGCTLKPDYALGFIGWGDALVGMLEYDEALAKYKKALELEPNNTEYQTIYEDLVKFMEERKKEANQGESR